MPSWFISAAARMKNGMAVSSMLLTLETMFCGIRIRSYPPASIPKVVASPSAMAMGMPSDISSNTEAKTMKETNSVPPGRPKALKRLLGGRR